jgi:sugar/nucleoside kinase (ribokinase family)
VDGRGEPAYLGYPGTLQIDRLPTAWREPIAAADALFADGWAESNGIIRLVLETFRHAAEAAVPLFFDPGPGNPDVDNAWHSEAASLSTVVLATEEEAGRITGRSDAVSAARELLANGPELVIIKRGVAGCLLVSADDLEIAPGFPVEARDATGAGDSFAAAIIFGYLRGLPLRALGTLANATGAAKVQKLGTGRNMPTLEEVEAIIQRFDVDDDPLALLDQ